MTPLGATATPAGAVARRIVNYLEGDQPSPARQLLAPDGADGAVRYFSDSMEGPGRWMGRGAEELGLVGTVAREQFAWVLEGRHPVTGARLVSARGSAGRSHLAVGTASRFDDDGEPLYSMEDTASLLKLPVREVLSLVAAGDRSDALDPNVADWVHAITDERGHRWVSDAEVRRWLDLSQTGVTGDAVRRTGAPDEVLSVPQAAGLLGVSRQYVSRLCQSYQRDRADIDSGASTIQHIRCARTERNDKATYRIRRGDLAAFADRRRQPAVRCAFDLTLTTEKSFGVLMMLASGNDRRSFEDALDAANAVAISHLEEHAAFTRHKGQRVGTTGLMVASYLHGTSRALDPFPHRHNIAVNTALDANGDRKTLDARAFYEQAPVAAALATAEMRWRLSSALGVGWRRSPRGVWEIDGVPDGVLDEFSRRRDDIEAAVAELEALLDRPVTKTEVQQLVLDTRSRKQPTTIAELLSDWHSRATAAGLDPDDLGECFHRGNRPTTWDGELQRRTFDRLAGSDGLTADLNRFTRGDVIRALVDEDLDSGQPLILRPDEIISFADRFLADERVVEIHESPAGEGIRATSRQATFTTVDLLETQERIRLSFQRGRRQDMGAVSDEVVDAAIACSGLDAGQRELVRAFCTSGDRTQVAVGPPGSGKTATMAAAARAWQQAGYRVLGAAVKGEAARHLGKAAEIESNTLAWYLAQDDLERHPFDARTVVIVDEATTIGDRQLDRLMSVAEETGAALRLIGDPAQHGSVGAGGSFAALTELGDTPELDGNKRLRSPVERRIADLVRSGQIPAALSAMTSAGTLIEAESLPPALAQVVHRWWLSRQGGDHHPMVDRLNHTRRSLNTIAHRLLLAAGDLGAESRSFRDGLVLHPGDEVIAKRPARHLHPADDQAAYVRNGSLGVVQAIYDGGILVAFDDLGTVFVPDAFIESEGGAGLDYAYAVTSYAVQGATFARSTSVITPASSRNELYVDITRGRDENLVVAVQPPEERDDEPHLPRLPPPPLISAITAGISQKTGESSAFDADPVALPAARHRHGRSLRDLEQERRECGPKRDATWREEMDRAIALAEGGIGRAAVTSPPASAAALLGPRPAAPWRRRSWEAAVGRIAVFEARWDAVATDRPSEAAAAEHAAILEAVAHIRERPGPTTAPGARGGSIGL